MSKKKSTTNDVPKVGPGFQPGHPRFAGRKKRTAQMARDLAESLGCDPLAFMMRVINSDTIEQTVIEADGTEKRIKIPVDLATRLDAAKAVANYLYPRLSAQQISGADDGPIHAVTFDMTALMRDPAAVEAAQSLALAMVMQPAQRPGFAPFGSPGENRRLNGPESDTAPGGNQDTDI